MTADPQIRAIAALDDELRRGMYRFIRATGRAVTRDEAAAEVGISRKLAAFHLDKLVDAGVLQADYQSTSGLRRVGRAPKVYQPVDADLRISIPPRRHDLLADILLEATLAAQRPDADSADSENVRDAALRTARERGQRIGTAEREHARPGRLGVERALTRAATLLQEHGFEPDRQSPTCMRLGTCPFHPHAGNAPELVCAINQTFLNGVLTGLHATTTEAILDPHEQTCCVELRGLSSGDTPSD